MLSVKGQLQLNVVEREFPEPDTAETVKHCEYATMRYSGMAVDYYSDRMAGAPPGGAGNPHNLMIVSEVDAVDQRAAVCAKLDREH
jgi:hypothetical protein